MGRNKCRFVSEEPKPKQFEAAALKQGACARIAVAAAHSGRRVARLLSRLSNIEDRLQRRTVVANTRSSKLPPAKCTKRCSAPSTRRDSQRQSRERGHMQNVARMRLSLRKNRRFTYEVDKSSDKSSDSSREGDGCVRLRRWN